ncbi:MAG TPA: hypothetical protein V6C98_18050 [Thermosynechococcaceae cyanobacterium]|jgi:hypothetical protein
MIDQILQAWADNVPESAVLKDELKIKLAQSVADVITLTDNIAPTEKQSIPPEAKRAVWRDPCVSNGNPQYSGWAWKCEPFGKSRGWEKMNHAFLPDNALPSEQPKWICEDDLTFV